MEERPQERLGNIQSNTAPTFIALSLDVLINVIKYLQPCDIVAVRQTCRTLLSITKLRTVWVNALRSVMQNYFITEDTFPLQTMSLPMLEHSALSPRRFISLMEKSDNRQLEPTSTRVLSPRLTNREKATHGLSDTGHLHDMILAPGGRYLATIADCDGDSSHFTIWDLGLSGIDGIKALAHLRVAQLEDYSFVNFFPDLKKHGIFYLVTRSTTILP
ncbi:hypothetical protein GALMADRAFT_61953 [Galerina marginata CBS 339.88]|uniref:F-box domain-containing protein n=1 Tax=Galerina marginata (strain CBS 339.88) TaxID=685588 RepID=A0A067T9K3_GALM3|nr:hypothetical protein GALMADRAFT_61953 [Galerina marginata CBS 339.88]